MAEQIGIRLNLQGAAQVTGGLAGVTRSLGELDAKTLKVGDAFKSLGPQLAAALSVGTIAAFVKSAIDATEQAGRLSQQLGIAVENLGGLELAFRRSGLQADQMAPLLSKLSVAVAKGSEALNAMGISTRNADGSLRDTMSVLREVMDRFAGYRDGVAKTTLAVGLFGEEGVKLVPLLNRGAAGMAEFDRQARAMGLTVDNEASEAARRFNEQVDLLQMRLGGLSRTVASQMLPVLSDFAKALNDTITQTNDLRQRDTLASWAEDAAIAVATVAEALVGVAKTVGVVVSAFRAVFTDVSTFAEVFGLLRIENRGGIFNPENRAAIQRALQDRNDVVQEFNEKLDNLWNYDGTALSRRLRESFNARRRAQAQAQGGTAPDTRPSAPEIGGGPGAAGAAAAANAERDIRARQDLARLGREDAAQAAADEAARRAAQLQLEADEKDSLNRLLRYDRAVADAEAAHQAELERIAQDALRQQARYDDATLAAEQTSAEALQRELELQADRALAQQVREYDAERAADAAIKAEREVRAAQDLAAIARYDAAELAAEAAHQRELQLQADIALAALVREYEAEEEATREYLRQREAYRDYLLTLQDQITQAQIQDAAAVQKYLDDQTEAARRNLESIQARTADLELDAKASALAAAQAISLAEAIELVTIARLREQQAMYRAGTEGYDAIEREIQAREKLLGALGDQRVRQANDQAAKDAAAQWERTVDQVGQSLADALMSGGKSAGDALKRYFSTLVLQPIIKAIVDPVARVIVGSLGLAGTAAASTGGGAGGLSILSGVNSISSLVGAVSGSAASSLGGLIGGFGNAIGSTSLGLFGSGMQGASLAAGLAGPTTAGAGGAMGAGAAFATALPWLAAAGALAALWQPLFGRKLKDTGIEGFLTGSGFDGSQYNSYKGGLFRSDKTTRQGVQPELEAFLDTSLTTLRDSTMQMARDMGLAADAVNGFNRQIKISFMGLTEEEIQQKLAKELGSVADEMARLAGGAGTTADSLRQLYQQVMSERAQLETQLLQLQGDTAELRRREREAIHESNRALFDRIVALRDEQAALAAATAAATSAAADALARQISASQSAANAARQAADAYAQAGSSLRQTIVALLGTGSPGASAASAYRTGLAAAQAGDATAMGNLGALASTYAESLRGTARTRAEANIGAARIAAELQGVAALSDTLGGQRSAQAALLDINTAALQVLQEDLQNGNLTVETLQQHTTLLQAINASLGSSGAIASAMQALDANVDGLLTFEELQRGLAGKASDDQIRALIARVDTNGDRQVSVQELAADQVRQRLELVNRSTVDVAQRILTLTGELIAGFDGLDANVDGLLTFEELQRGLAGKASDDQIRALIARADRNSDAQVSLQELTAERVRSVILGTGDIVTAANRTTATTGSVADATGGVIDEQSRAISFLASSDSTLARVLAKLSESDPTSLLLVDRITSGNTLVADRLSQVISAINMQTAAQQAEVKRQQDLQRAQADLKSASSYLGSLQGNVQSAQATLAGTPATTSVRVGTRYDWLGFAKGGIYEERANPAFAAAQQAEAEAQAALRAYEPQVNALRDLIRSLGGVPAFAMGGLHSGGLRIVGERGPELEATGPARYWSAADTAAMLGNGQRREELLAAEVRALRAEMANLHAAMAATASHTAKTSRILERVTPDGNSLQTVAAP
jgi:hypothetical protein